MPTSSPIQVATPTLPARRRSRCAMNSPIAAPASGMNSSPQRPVKMPASVPIAAPSTASLLAPAFFAPAAAAMIIHRPRDGGQDAEDDQQPHRDAREIVDPRGQHDAAEHEDRPGQQRQHRSRDADERSARWRESTAMRLIASSERFDASAQATQPPAPSSFYPERIVGLRPRFAADQLFERHYRVVIFPWGRGVSLATPSNLSTLTYNRALYRMRCGLAASSPRRLRLSASYSW